MSAISKWKNEAAIERRKRASAARKYREAKVPNALMSAGKSAAGAAAVAYGLEKAGVDTVAGVDGRVAVGLLGIGAGWAMGNCTVIDMSAGPLIHYAGDYGAKMASK